jgi:hypothetical protein
LRSENNGVRGVFEVDEGIFVCVKSRQTSSRHVNTNKTHDPVAWVIGPGQLMTAVTSARIRAKDLR